MSNPTATDQRSSGGGRPRRSVPRARMSGKPIKPTVAGQVEFGERDALDALSARTGRTQSYIMRGALLILLEWERRGGGPDWSKSADEWFPELMNELRGTERT